MILGKVWRFVGREFRTAFRLTVSPGRFFSRRTVVKNVLALYLIESSFVLRLIVRALDGRLRRSFVPIRVRYRNGLVLAYPLRHYLHHADDLFVSYADYYRRTLGLRDDFTGRDVIIDVGAHLGTFSLPLAKRHGLRVIAIEPSDENCRYLQASVTESHLTDRVTVRAEAIGGKAGTTTFFEGNASTRGGTVPSSYTTGGQGRAVRCQTLGDVVRQEQIASIALLKVDCEGAEYDMFGAVPPELFGKIQEMIVEVHPVSGRDPAALVRLLESAGFVARENPAANGCRELALSRARVPAEESDCS